jgi:hypothetical protein
MLHLERDRLHPVFSVDTVSVSVDSVVVVSLGDAEVSRSMAVGEEEEEGHGCHHPQNLEKLTIILGQLHSLSHTSIYLSLSVHRYPIYLITQTFSLFFFTNTRTHIEREREASRCSLTLSLYAHYLSYTIQGILKGVSITVPLTSCLTGLD